MTIHSQILNIKSNIPIQKYRRLIHNSVVFFVSLFIFLSSFSLSILWAVNEDDTSDESRDDEVVVTESVAHVPTRTILLDEFPTNAPYIDATAFALFDVQSETFIIGRDCDMPLSPASTTKVLTVLLALENLDLDSDIVVTEEMYNTIPEGYVRIPLEEGEVIKVRDAVYASMLISANDACSALAVAMAGSEEAFAEMMNRKAIELGCTQSNFVNSYGLSDPDHLTSVRDMVLILEAALEHDLFQQIAISESYTIQPTNAFPDNREIANNNRFISTPEYSYQYYIGGKTGFTNLSGYTIVAAAEIEGRVLIAVIFGASCPENRYVDLVNLFNFGFSNYTTVAIDHSEVTITEEETCIYIEDIINEQGLEIYERELNLLQYITTSTESFNSGYVTRIDLSAAVIDPALNVQSFSFPVVRDYANGQSYVIGTLDVVIASDASSLERINFSSPGSRLKLGDIILRIMIVLVLVIVLSLAIMVYHTRQKRRKAIKNRRKPKVL